MEELVDLVASGRVLGAVDRVEALVPPLVHRREAVVPHVPEHRLKRLHEQYVRVAEREPLGPFGRAALQHVQPHRRLAVVVTGDVVVCTGKVIHADVDGPQRVLCLDQLDVLQPAVPCGVPSGCHR